MFLYVNHYRYTSKRVGLHFKMSYIILCLVEYLYNISVAGKKTTTKTVICLVGLSNQTLALK